MSKRTKWTDEALIIEASKYATRNAFNKGSRRAYQAARKRGALDLICEHMTPLLHSYTKESVAAEALRYSTRANFLRGSNNAYGFACRNGLLDEICSHMTSAMGGTDNDTIYLWRAVGQFFNGEPVYKIGVTSDRLGDWRLDIVSKRSGFEIEIICRVKVKGAASRLESALHLIGQDPGYSGFDGCTEFRALSDHQLAAVMALINEAAE